MANAISAACVSSAKCPVSKKRTTAPGMSRLNASAPGGERTDRSCPTRRETAACECANRHGKPGRARCCFCSRRTGPAALVRAWARQIEVVQRSTIGGDHRLVGHTVGILPTRRFGSEEGAESFSIGWRRVLPVSADGVPALAEPLLVGVAILRDDCGDAVRMFCGDPEARRRAVVEDVDREALQTDHFGEAVNDAGDVIECVRELAPRRHLRLAETWQVGGDDVEAIGQERDEIAEHVARAGEAVKQQQRRRIGAPGLAIKDLETVHVGRTIFDGSHCVSPSEHPHTRAAREGLSGQRPIGPWGIGWFEVMFRRSGSEYSPFGRHSSAARSNAGLVNGRSASIRSG
jgi:hypothetical protein